MDPLPSYLDELDQLLLSQSEDCMLLSQLDGFLAGVLVSPETTLPGAWLKCVWAGEHGDGKPDFDDLVEFQRFVDLIMHHYNQLLSSFGEPGSFEPVFDIDTRNGDILWEIWMEGFTQAMALAPSGWRTMATNGDTTTKAAMTGIQTLAALVQGSLKLSRKEQEDWHAKAPSLIPIWVEMLYAWRLQILPPQSHRETVSKVGRNDPCSCGSGKKYKKCCGLN